MYSQIRSPAERHEDTWELKERATGTQDRRGSQVSSCPGPGPSEGRVTSEPQGGGLKGQNRNPSLKFPVQGVSGVPGDPPAILEESQVIVLERQPGLGQSEL